MLYHIKDLCLVAHIKHDLIWWDGYLTELCIEVRHFFIWPFACEGQWLYEGQAFRLLIMLKEKGFIKEVKAVKWEAVSIFQCFHSRIPNLYFLLKTFIAKEHRLAKYFRFLSRIGGDGNCATHHDKHFIALVPLTIDNLIFEEVVELHASNQGLYSVSIVDLKESYLSLQIHL